MFFQTSYMSPQDISSRWDNTPMRDYSTWNLKIVPFVFRVYQRVFIYMYIVDLYTLRYLSKHHVIKIKEWGGGKGKRSWGGEGQLLFKEGDYIK